MLIWHLRLNHLPFNKLNTMALQGRIPKLLLQAVKPLCPVCSSEKATRKPWKGTAVNKKHKDYKLARRFMSVDSYESAAANFAMKIK